MSIDRSTSRSIARDLGRGTGDGLGGGSAPAGPSYLVHDTFTDTDGVDLSAHTPDVDSVGGGWIDDTTAVEIQSNQAAGVGNDASSWIDAGNADVTVEVTRHTPISNRALRLMGRLTDTSNYIYLNISARGTDASSFRLFRREAGAGTTIASGTYTVNISSTYNVKLAMSGSSVSAYLDDGTPLTATETFNQTATKHGLLFERNPGANGGYADDFKVYT